MELANTLIERHRLRRKLTFWRAATLITIVLATGAVVFGFGGDTLEREDQIARIAIEGTILENKELIGRIEEAGEDEAVKAIILTVDSPGGTTVGGEAIHEAIKNAAGQKPVVAEIGTLAASAGYMVASASDHIVSRETSLVGSIGVIIQGPNFTRALDKVGIDVETYKSAPLKAEPSPFNATTDEERAAIDAVIKDSYDWFVDLVAENRGMDRAEVLRVASGAIYTGRQAKALGLVDELGGESVVRAWLTAQDISADLPIIDWEAPRDLTSGWLAGLAGRNGTDIRPLLREIGLDPLFLDGLVSVWQGHDLTARRN